MFNDLKELISIKSVMGEKEEGAPFGIGPKMALDWFLNKAKEYGLKTENVDGYAGYAEYGEGETCIAALCHLDVVPEGEGWTTNPYDLTIDDGRAIGRGVADDKGAAIMCLHALKEIKEAGIKTNKRIRVIVGLNEEHGSDCIRYYKQKAEIPELSFTPDSEFPIINSEKGILHIAVRLQLDKFFSQNIAHILGGKSINVVPDTASVSIFKDSPLGKRLIELGKEKISKDIFLDESLVGAVLASGVSLDSLSIIDEGEIISISATGLGGHASVPHKCDNAIWKIFKILDVLSEGESPIVSLMNEYFCTKISAERLNIYKEDEESGNTTINMGMIDVDDDNLNFTLDIRLPISIKMEEVKKAIDSALSVKHKIEVLRYAPNLYVDKDSPLVKTLLEVYESVTKNEGYCIKTGGGTYARELPNAVAFGPVFPNYECNLHKADESLKIEDFYKAFEIYKEAFIRLSK